MRFLLFSVLAAMPLTSQAALVAWYPLDEGAGITANDASGHGNTLSSTGTWLSSGAFGGSIQLGPLSSLLARTGSSGSLSGLNATTGNKLSVSFWMKANNESSGSSVFYAGDSTTSAGNRFFNLHMEWTDGITYWDAGWPNPGSGPRLSGDLGAVSDALHHYVLTYDGDSGAMSIYRDGSVALSGTASTTASLPWASIQSFEIGALSFSSFWPGGQIDDFAIFNHVLSQAEVNTARTLGVSALVPEPSTATFALFSVTGLAILRRRR
jgi:hypothetical protein